MGKLDSIAAIKDFAIKLGKRFDSKDAATRERIQRVLRHVEERIIEYCASLRTMEAGSKAALDRAQAAMQAIEIRRQVADSFSGFYKESAAIVGGYAESAAEIEKSFGFLPERMKDFANVDKQVISSLQQVSYKEFERLGDAFQGRIADELYRSVLTARPFPVMVRSIKASLTGHEDVRGRPMAQYAGQIAHDEFMKFNRSFATTKAAGVGIQYFLFTGSLIHDSRPFCVERCGKIFTKDQIDAWEKLDWAGKNPNQPVMVALGGYNCRHHLSPVPEFLARKMAAEQGFELPKTERSDVEIIADSAKKKTSRVSKTEKTPEQVTKEEVAAAVKPGAWETPDVKILKAITASFSEDEVKAMEANGTLGIIRGFATDENAAIRAAKQIRSVSITGSGSFYDVALTKAKEASVRQLDVLKEMLKYGQGTPERKRFSQEYDMAKAEYDRRTKEAASFDSGYSQRTFAALVVEMENAQSELEKIVGTKDELIKRAASANSYGMKGIAEEIQSGLEVLIKNRIEKNKKTDQARDVEIREKIKERLVDGVSSAGIVSDRMAAIARYKEVLDIIDAMPPDYLTEKLAKIAYNKVPGRAGAYDLQNKIEFDIEETANTVAHEFGHHVEFRNDSLKTAIVMWRNKRAFTSEMRPLWGSVYDEPVRNVEKHFFHQYAGKQYSDDSTEVLSMGFEIPVKTTSGRDNRIMFAMQSAFSKQEKKTVTDNVFEHAKLFMAVIGIGRSRA